MRKTYKYKLQSQSNAIKLGNMLDDMWHIHVHIMTLQRRYYRRYKKNISAYRMNAHIKKLKDTTKPHWRQLPSQVIQDVVLRYGKAYDAFFRNIKEREAGLTTRKVGKLSARKHKPLPYEVKIIKRVISCMHNAGTPLCWRGFLTSPNYPNIFFNFIR